MIVGDTYIATASLGAVDSSALPTVRRRAIDPSALTCTVTAPDDVETTYDLGDMVRRTSGEYELPIPCTMAGTYRLRWEASGNTVGAKRDSFKVYA